MRRARGALWLALALSLASCGDDERPATPRVNESMAGEERAQWLRRAAQPCRMISDSMREQTGSRPIACSEGRTNQEAIQCANDAVLRRQPFTLCNSGWGMDSLIETGVAGLTNGNVLTYYFDTLGPAYRGTCLPADVSLDSHDWPQCRTALLDQVDLRTGKPYVERQPIPYEEDWPASCAQAALRAPRSVLGIRLAAGENPIPNPERFGLACRDSTTSFEMLVGRTGKVTCARIIYVGRHAPAPGLFDAVRSNLLHWRFRPPMLHGRPIEVRWGMTLPPIPEGEELPGPKIYPVCPDLRR